MPKKNLLIVYHTQTKGTQQMVQALANEASGVEDLIVTIQPAGQTVAADLMAADAYVFASPEYLAGMSGVMKDFFDRTYYELLGKIEGRPYATLICAGSDGAAAARQIQRIVTGWRLKAVSEPIIVNVHAQTYAQIMRVKKLSAQQLKPCQELGALMGAGLTMGIY